MKPRIIKQEPIHLIGYSITTTSIQNENNKDIPMLWQDYLRSGKMKKLHTEPFIESHHEYGVCLPLNSDQTTFDYMIGVSVSAPLKAIIIQATQSLPDHLQSLQFQLQMTKVFRTISKILGTTSLMNGFHLLTMNLMIPVLIMSFILLIGTTTRLKPVKFTVLQEKSRLRSTFFLVHFILMYVFVFYIL